MWNQIMNVYHSIMDVYHATPIAYDIYMGVMYAIVAGLWFLIGWHWKGIVLTAKATKK